MSYADDDLDLVSGHTCIACNIAPSEYEVKVGRGEYKHLCEPCYDQHEASRCATCENQHTTTRRLFGYEIPQCVACAARFDRNTIADDEPTARIDADRLEALKLEARMS